MKRLLGYFVIVAFLVTVPFMSVAKQSLSDGEMGSLTAQEGVTVNLGAFVPPTATFGVMVTGFMPDLQSWGDGDGFSGYTDSGWFGATTTTSVTSHIGVGGSMTIDVGSDAVNGTAVRIGLPRAMLHTFTTDQTLKLSTSKQLSDAQPALGTTYNDVFAAILNPTGTSAITISSHAAGEGVDINFGAFNPAQPLIAIPGAASLGFMTQSWGDNDGYTGMTDAGFFGTRNMTVADGAYMYIFLSGTMTIDVGNNGTDTGVRVVLPRIDISTDGITQPLVLAASKDLLTTNPQVLGTSYMGGVYATITGAMTITAH
jgi:hypothetical protein